MNNDTNKLRLCSFDVFDNEFDENGDCVCHREYGYFHRWIETEKGDCIALVEDKNGYVGRMRFEDIRFEDRKHQELKEINKNGGKTNSEIFYRKMIEKLAKDGVNE